jgi:hypothetical protein
MPEYQRLEYCLKMNLRLINSTFEDMVIHQINQTQPGNVDQDNLTKIETMELYENQVKFELLKKDRRLNISRTNPKVFTFGSTLEDASLISEDSEYTFLVFKVAVGRSYCYKLGPNEAPESVPLKDGFDSVYIDETQKQMHE